MRARQMLTLLVLAVVAMAPTLRAGQSADAQAAAVAGSAAAEAKPRAEGAATKSQTEGAAVVEQIRKDKEDLIEGKRFSYDPGGRRDPFRSLLEQVSRFKGPRPKGITGMLVGEVDLVGIVKDRSGNVAFFRGSDNKGYFLRLGDEMYDGRVLGIDPDAGAVTFRQRVDDPRQIKPYRDIIKRLSPGSEEEAQ